MALTAGDKLGPYEILGLIGAGGMGEVYRARDTKLKRDVALKVLPEAFASDPNRMMRFQREAEVLASLNHPNIAHIYGVEDRALVMELVEGETLASHRKRSPETALDYARQIASALEAAHEKGITHRDLKPGNVMITPAGSVKVLDFGLAAVSHASSAAAKDPADSPTLTMAATEAGVILGTAAYMSPEQASGQTVDKRADIWAFGVVLYELLTGQRLFTGKTTSHILAAVLAKEPDLTAIPASVRPVIERCLRKDPQLRWHDIGDVRILLEQTAADTPTAAPVQVRRQWLPWMLAGALAIVAAVSAWALWRTPPTAAERPFVQLDLDAGPDEISQPAVSPDGSLLVFVLKDMLATRRLDKTVITPLAGTEGAQFPFFSPDGQWVAFFAEGKLKKIALNGGVPQTLCNVGAARGGSWGTDNFIIAPINILGGLSRIPATGGEPQPLTDIKGDPEGMTAHRWPQILPGGKGLIFSATQGLRGSLRARTPGGQIKSLVPGSPFGRYLPSGHLVYYAGGAILAAPFDLDRLELTGPPISLAERVAFTPNVAHADFDVSPSGTLVYVRGNSGGGRIVSWLDSSGTLTPLLQQPREYAYPRLSPDGKKLAVVISEDGPGANLWVYDLVRETLTRLTSDGLKIYPVWTPDGAFIVFGSGAGIAWTRSDGSAKGETAIRAATAVINTWSFLSDGKQLAYSGDGQFWIVSVQETAGGLSFGKPEPVSAGTTPAISPNGRFVAYSSSQSDRSEVYAMPFPSSGDAGKATSARWQVSSAGGSYPLWSQAGTEIFFRGADRRIWAANYKISSDTFTPEKAHPWSPRQLAEFGNSPTYDMAADGKHAVVLLDAGSEDPKPETHIRVLLNVPDELRRRAASGATK